MSNPTNVFLILGAHLSENLEHHKTSDVTRILEEKGFAKDSADAAQHIEEPGFSQLVGKADRTTQVYVQQDGSDDGKRTVVFFDVGNFVLPDNGVKFYESAGPNT